MDINSQIVLSPNVRKIENGDKALIYDCKTGKSLILKKGALTVLDLLSQGVSTEEIKNRYDAPGLDDLIDNLLQKKILLKDNEPAAAFKWIPHEESITSGNLLRHLRINVTEKCNLDCSYCYERVSNVYTKRRTMSWDVAKRALDEFLNLAAEHKHKEVTLRFFGGEPMLNWGVVEKCVEYAEEKKLPDTRVKYILNTNGTLITEDNAKFMHEHEIGIGLSLDGVDEYHDKARKYRNGDGSFRVIDQNMDILIAHKCQFGCAVVCSDHNLPHMQHLIDYLKRKQELTQYPVKVNFSQVSRISRERIDSLSPREKVSHLINAVRYAQECGVRCYGGLTHFVLGKLVNSTVGTFCAGIGGEFSVDPEGNIFPCSGLDIKLGTLDDFRGIFRTPQYKQLFLRRAGMISHCRGCEIEGFCAGGCLADVVFASGDLAGNYPDCELQKLMFKELLKEYVLN